LKSLPISLFAIEQIFVTILAIVLALVILKYAKNNTHRLWSFFNFSVAGWSFFVFLVGITSNDKQAMHYWKCSFVFIPFIGAFFYHFVLSYCSLKRPRFLKIVYLHSVIFSSLSIFTNIMFSRIFLLFNTIVYGRATFWLSVFFLSWCGIVLKSFIEFHIFLRKTSGLQRIQSQFMFWSMLAGFAGGVSIALPCYGINIYPCFQILIIFYIIFTSYAIFKHGVIPLDEIIKRSIIYSTLGTAVTIIYFVGIFLFARAFDKIVGYNNLAGSLLLLVVIGIILIPLRNKIQSMVDKFILKNSPIEIAAQNENLRNEVAKTDKFRTIANLASMLAHEIKNPLANLLLYTEKLKDKKDEPGFIEEYQKIVIEEIRRINLLLHGMLVYSKPSEPQIIQMNPNVLIDQIYKLVQGRCENSKIDIDCQFNTEIFIPGDPNLIKQAIFNLVLNAIDAMPQGGKLTISTQEISKFIPQGIKDKAAPKDLYSINISDTGCGIDQKDLPFIFDPFYSKKEDGTGLGLPITQGIIEKHGGRIEVKSKLNVGSTFNIILGMFKQA
jgi:signal transduction histidine kinase